MLASDNYQASTIPLLHTRPSSQESPCCRPGPMLQAGGLSLLPSGSGPVPTPPQSFSWGSRTTGPAVITCSRARDKSPKPLSQPYPPTTRHHSHTGRAGWVTSYTKDTSWKHRVFS